MENVKILTNTYLLRGFFTKRTLSLVSRYVYSRESLFDTNLTLLIKKFRFSLLMSVDFFTFTVLINSFVILVLRIIDFEIRKS